MSKENILSNNHSIYGKKRRASFSSRLDQCTAEEYAEEASLAERGRMMTFHFALMSAIFILIFIMMQWILGQYMASKMAPALTSEMAQARMMAVNISALFVAAFSVFSLGLVSKTPLTYYIFNARVVKASDFSEISATQATLRCFIKTAVVIITPLALFYWVRKGDANVVDGVTGTRVIVFRKALIDCGETPLEEDDGEVSPKINEPVEA